MGKENERKFLVRYIPDINPICISKIEQTYLAIGSEELRVRKEVIEGLSNYFMTFKVDTKDKDIREEDEKGIKVETYNQLVRGIPIIKIRTKYNIGNSLIAELDKYPTFPSVVEVEFKSKEQSTNFIIPDWFGEEITGRKEYKNQCLWERLQKNI